MSRAARRGVADPATEIPAGAALLKVTDVRVDGPLVRLELGSDVADLAVNESAGGDPGFGMTYFVGNGILVLSSGQDLSSIGEWECDPMFASPGENGRVDATYFFAAPIVIGGESGFGTPDNGFFRPALSTRLPPGPPPE